jgi:hypothetical protein
MYGNPTSVVRMALDGVRSIPTSISRIRSDCYTAFLIRLGNFNFLSSACKRLVLLVGRLGVNEAYLSLKLDSREVLSATERSAPNPSQSSGSIFPGTFDLKAFMRRSSGGICSEYPNLWRPSLRCSKHRPNNPCLEWIIKGLRHQATYLNGLLS